MSSTFEENKVPWEEHKEIFIEKDKMIGIRKIGLFSLFVVGTLFVGTASATYHLPDSSYDDHFGQGSPTRRDNSFNVLTDSAICGVEKTPFSYKVTMFERSTIARRCIDAYQMFNHPNAGYETIEYFDILDLDGHQIGGALFQGESACYDNWSCREVLIPQRNGSQRGSEKTFINRGCLGGDRYLQF